MKAQPAVLRRSALALAVLAGIAGALALRVPTSIGGTQPPELRTAIVDSIAFGVPDATKAFDEANRTGATFVRLILDWQVVAPGTLTDGFNASDPADPGYRWEGFDAQVRGALTHGLQPIVDITSAPLWARPKIVPGGPYKPDLRALARFATAVASRYGGRFQGLPRVRYWQLWNEPNLAVYLRPQFVGSTLYSAIWYRAMVNSFADAVHAVHSDNTVIAGATSPFRLRAGKPSSWGPGPLLFLRTMLCLSRSLKPTCTQKVHFDVWAHHPYTTGGPNHHANIVDDVSIADLPKMKAVLDAGVASGHIVSRTKLRLWVTEFSWDTNPPDPGGMPMALHTRWVSEALYRMWQAGVSLVTWYSLEDNPYPASPYQSGLYFRNGKPKPSLQAFRFPFVAFRRDGGIDVWGRTPSSRRGQVVVEQLVGGAWERLGTLSTNAAGIFSRHYSSRATGPLRAGLVAAKAELSRPFSLVEPPDHYYSPFGKLS